MDDYNVEDLKKEILALEIKLAVANSYIRWLDGEYHKLYDKCKTP